MQICVLITLCFAVSLSRVVNAEGGHDVKRGIFPFMAFIYYPDETVVDITGSRFLRSAVLIRADWLVSSAVGPSVVDGASDSFPRKTLLARLGAINIDANFTLNEDEDEQEREVVQIVRPYNHSSTQWWRTDISLLKTLEPFKMSSAVGIATLNLKRDYNEKTCFILIYAKRHTDSIIPEDKILMQLSMELLPASIATCGNHFVESTMICASDSVENKNTAYNSNFCQGNSGGPLICDNEVTGLQTYIENNCNPPHIYQHLSAWDNFISCGAENKCHEEQCANICIVSDKDAPTTDTTSTKETKFDSVYVQTESIDFAATRTTVAVPEHGTEDDDLAGTPTLRSTALPTVTETKTQQTTTEQQTKIVELTITSTISSTSTTTLPEVDIAETKSWPNEKLKEDRKKLDQDDAVVARKTNIESQQQDVKGKKLKDRNIAQRNMCIFETVFFGSIVLMCLN